MVLARSAGSSSLASTTGCLPCASSEGGMIPDPSDTDRVELPAVFNEAAEDYDRTRPVCPPELFDDLVALTGLLAGDEVLEIGSGTGQATVPLARRGLAVTAIEVGAALAAIARRRLTGLPLTRVSTG